MEEIDDIVTDIAQGCAGKGQRVRTLPHTAPVVPIGIAKAEPDDESKIERPLEAELEHHIVDPPFDEWHVYRGFGSGTGGAS